MRNSILSNFFSVKKNLHYLFLPIIFCWITRISIIAQVTETDAKTDLLTVSEEVYKSIAQFYEYDRNIELEPRVIQKNELSDGNREKIVFVGIDQIHVPSYLVLPKSEAAKYPIVLLVDGIYGSKERWFEDDSWPKGGLVTKALLQAGFAVMILDAVYHGERSAENEYAGPPWPLSYPHTGIRMVMQTAIEYRRAIDYLSTRSDIDTTRIGMMGLSMGGLITFELTSIDSRIKTAVAGLTPLFKRPDFQPIESSTFATRVRCNSFLMFMGNNDQFYTMEEARQLYDWIPITQKEFVEYDIGHEAPAEYVEEITNWFIKYLKP
jgi:dienelactone hydrolase